MLCPTTTESMAEGSPHWTLGASQGMGECWAQNHCLPQPWWWCKACIGVVGVSSGIQQGIPYVNANNFVAHLKLMWCPMLIMSLLVFCIRLIQDVVHLLANVLDAFNKPHFFISLILHMCGLYLCSCMRHGNINQTQWLKSQTHFKGTAVTQAMESYAIIVSHIRKDLIPGLWMLGVVHA